MIATRIEHTGNSMDVHKAYLSNPPTPSSVAGRALPDEAVVNKGFVSTRIDAYRKNIATAGGSQPSYPPSFPRARFERVQTREDWPSYNAELYTQPHPRTMSLAPSSALETSKYRQHEQQECIKRSEFESKGDPSRSLGVTGLKHLWESRGQSKITANVLNYTFTGPTLTTPVGERSPTCEGRTNDSPMHVATPKNLQSQQFMLETEDLPGSTQNFRGLSKVKSRRYEQGLETASANLPLYSSSSNAQGKDESILAKRDSCSPTRHFPSRSSDGVDQPSKSFKAQHPRIGPSTFPAGPDSYHSDARSTFSARSTPLSPTPRRGWSVKSRHYERQIPTWADESIQDCGPIHQVSSSDSQYHSIGTVKSVFSTEMQDDIGRDKEDSIAGTANILEHEIDYGPTAPVLSGTQNAATQTDLVDDRHVHKDLDKDNGRDGDRDRDRDLERHLEEKSSGWSETKSVAERPGQRLSRQRSSKPVRLERRLGRRPGVRRVQVIVSLDGATDLVMDARLKRKRVEGSCRS
ncbi:MAG: hypothetical protein Q9209_000620 [Squamulea sp. 1 TL-2023]